MEISHTIINLIIFVLAIYVGYHVVWTVTPALHTPLMGGAGTTRPGTTGQVVWPIAERYEAALRASTASDERAQRRGRACLAGARDLDIAIAYPDTGAVSLLSESCRFHAHETPQEWKRLG